jgi:Neurotransmitter-gated ion-channel ligand binding domain.
VNIALTNGRNPLGLLRRFLLLGGLFVASVELAHSSETPALIDRPNADSGSTQISVGIWMADISNIDSAQQNFTAELAVVLRWKDSRLAHTGKGIVRYPLEQIWHPRVSIVNETNSVSRRLPESVEVESDGTVTSGNVTPEPSRNRCDCNHSRSIGKLFASSWSRFGISPTK